MDWQHKAAALNALSGISIRTRGPDDWYVSQATEIGGNGLLEGSYGNGADPYAAIIDHWRVLVEDLPPGRFIVTRAMGEDRKQSRWNGYMWEEVP